MKPYSPERFACLADEFRTTEERIRIHKDSEYGGNGDVLRNFHQQALVQGVSPASIALTYLLKHVLSIANAVKTDSQPWVWATADGREGLKQRFADARTYLLLLAACIDEQRGDTA